MITKVQNNPEDVYVASGYKEIGKSFELNRQRVTNVVTGITQATVSSRLSVLSSLTSDNSIDEADRSVLKIEIQNLERNFIRLQTETRNADLGDSDEYAATKESYDRLYALMYKLMNTTGVYEGTDVANLTTYYSEYTANASTLEELIQNTIYEVERINTYYSLTKVSASVYPESVQYGSYTDVSASITYDGVEKVSDVSVDDIAFGITGMPNYTSTSVTTSGTTKSLKDTVTGNTLISVDVSTYPSATISYSSLTNSAEITGAKAFQIHYYGIGDYGVAVNCSVTLDSGSMPF